MLKKILQHKFVGILSIVSFLFSFGGFLWALFYLASIPRAEPLILHFNDIQGITHVGDVNLIFFMGMFGLITISINSALAMAFEEREAFFGKFIAVLTLIFSILLFIGFASIISVN